MYARIRHLCEKRKISIAFLERELGFPRSSIYKWDENEPGVSKVRRVASYFEISMEKLLDGEEDTHADTNNENN